jgi:hypothetical protein
MGWAGTIFVALMVVMLWPKRLEGALSHAVTFTVSALLVHRIATEEDPSLWTWIFAVFFGLFFLLSLVGAVLDKRSEGSSD